MRANVCCPHTFESVTRKFVVCLLQVRDLRHENVNTFIGACVEPGHVLVLSKLCPKGSLDDILQNDDIQLDLMFKISFMMDICAVSTTALSACLCGHCQSTRERERERERERDVCILSHAEL